MARYSFPPLTRGWRTRAHTVHLDLGCPGLDWLRVDGDDLGPALDPVRLSRAADLADVESVGLGRSTSLCRICAAGPVAVDIVRKYRRSRHAQAFVTFTMQRPQSHRHHPHRAPITDERRARVAAISDRMQAALFAAARAGGLSTATAGSGPVAFGFVTVDAARDLERVVRTETRMTVSSLPPASVVSTFWSLLSQTQGADADPWFLAEAIHAPGRVE